MSRLGTVSTRMSAHVRRQSLRHYPYGELQATWLPSSATYAVTYADSYAANSVPRSPPAHRRRLSPGSGCTQEDRCAVQREFRSINVCFASPRPANGAQQHQSAAFALALVPRTLFAQYTFRRGAPGTLTRARGRVRGSGRTHAGGQSPSYSYVNANPVHKGCP